MRTLIMSVTGFGLLLSAQTSFAEAQPIDKIRSAMETSIRKSQSPGPMSRFASDFARAAVADTPVYSTSSNDAIPARIDDPLYPVRQLRADDWAR